MGLSSLADSVTGLPFNKEETIVGFAVAKRQGGYPDAEWAAATPGASNPAHIFEFVSLPIYGNAGDYGDFVPQEGQASVALLLRMTKTSSWEEFEDKALNFSADGVPLSADGQQEDHHILGLSLMTLESFRVLKGEQGNDDALLTDLATVTDVLCQAVNNKDHPRWWNMINLASDMWEEKDLPDLACALSDGLCEQLGISRDLKNALRGKDGPFPLKEGANPNSEHIQEILKGIFETQAVFTGLKHANRCIMPSQNAGQGLYPEKVVDLSLSSISDAVAKLTAYAEYMDDPETLERARNFVRLLSDAAVELDIRIEDADLRMMEQEELNP